MTTRIVTDESIEQHERDARRQALARNRRVPTKRPEGQRDARFHDVLHGDCLERLRELPSNSVDSLVTDPPAGISFMNKGWDDDKGGKDQWILWLTGVMTECLRVLKPGAHALVWAIPRTSHWTAKAVEDAGFEVRDVITHHFGCGMPKSMDIAKALDKRAGQKGTPIEGTQISVPDMRGGKFVGAAGDEPRPMLTVEKTEPTTADAKKWKGFGTGLKPGSEHWILARKPPEFGTAVNVKRHGVGALDIDGSRIGEGAGARWPANLVLSHSPDCTPEACTGDCAVAAIDRMGEYTVSRPSAGTGKVNEGQWVYGKGLGGSPATTDDEGFCSRYFARFSQEPSFTYCPKPTAAERNHGCEEIDPQMKNDGFMDAILNPDGTHKFPRTLFHNFHPTVKSIRLMSYFVRLITPPGGVVLDPFAGSGTTLVAAKRIGRSAIGIERDDDYWKICKARLDNGAAYQAVKGV